MIGHGEGGLNLPADPARGPEGASVDDFKGLLTPFWRKTGEALVESCPRPVRTVDELMGQPTPRRSLGRPRPMGGKASVSSTSRPHLLRAGLLVLVLSLGALIGWVAATTKPASGSRHFVRLVHTAPDAGAVSVIGDFNGWDPDATPMSHRVASGVWEVWLDVAEGRHRYLFLVDGVTRTTDPFSAETVQDGRGGEVSVLHVTPDPRLPE